MIYKIEKRLEEDQSYEKETQIKDLLEEMQSYADEMAFEEHTFMQDELLSNLENDYSFGLHKQQFETAKAKIRQGDAASSKYAGIRAREG